jgi:hypothetical protein
MEDPPDVPAREGDDLESIPSPEIGGFFDAFNEMFIDVQVLPGSVNAHPTFPFIHDFATPAEIADTFLNAGGARDTKVESDHFWTVYLASVYELGDELGSGPVDNDGNPNDDDDSEFGLMGFTVDGASNPELSLLAQEVIRDVSAENAAAWEDLQGEQAPLQEIVALHEVGHQFLGTDPSVHGGTFPGHIMAAPWLDPHEEHIPAMQLLFSSVHVDQIRDDHKSGKHP